MLEPHPLYTLIYTSTLTIVSGHHALYTHPVYGAHTLVSMGVSIGVVLEFSFL